VRCICCVCVALSIAVPAAASPECMTKSEARQAHPRTHIFWHGSRRCWDDRRKGDGIHPERRTKAAAPVELPVVALDEAADMEPTDAVPYALPLPMVAYPLRAPFPPPLPPTTSNVFELRWP
jgi:hypothetical protein